MYKNIYDRIEFFKDKIYDYKELISKKLSDIDKPSEFAEIKELNEELLDLFYELKEIIYSEGNLQCKELHNQYQGNLGKVYDVALSNYEKYHIKDSLDRVYRDLKEILIKNKDKYKNDILIDNLISESGLSDDKRIEGMINNAKYKFYNSDFNVEDKRDSIKALADCLENYRESIKKTEFVKDDESDLFRIANEFGIRHLNKKQKLDYDDEIFYEWIFLSYYNTLKLYLKLIKRRDEKV